MNKIKFNYIVHIGNLKTIIMTSDTKFGIFSSLLLAIISLYLYIYISVNIYLISLFFTLVLIITTIFAPNKLGLVERSWIKFGNFLGLIISPIILGVVFYGIITPTALFLKIIGRDLLNLKKISKDSYWSNRDNSNIEPDRFKKQY